MITYMQTHPPRTIFIYNPEPIASLISAQFVIHIKAFSGVASIEATKKISA